jgi:hypothetical protein
MKNITKKDLQRMKELMGNKTPINENKNTSSVELIKKSPNGNYYGIVRETKKYYIKESNDGSNFDFIGGTANKIKNQFESYEQAVRRLNLMLEDTDVLTHDLIEGKKFVIKTKKKSVEPKVEKSTEGGFGGEEVESDFDFGGKEETTDTEEKTTDTEEGGDDFSFGDEEGTEEVEGDFDTEETEGDVDTEEDEDYDLESEDDPIKSIQKMTGKLGQKLRDTEDISSDMSKWVAKSVLSALNLEEMDGDDKKDLIRTIKKKKDKGTEEEFDFMDDDDEYKISDSDMEDDDMVDWNQLSDEEKFKIVNRPDDTEVGDDSCQHCNGMGHDDMTGEECEWCMGTGVEHMEDYMEDYMEDDGFFKRNRLYGPGDDELKAGEEILSDEDDDETEMGNYPGTEEDWMSDKEDYMSRFAKNVKRVNAAKGKRMDTYELDSYLHKIKNKLGGNVDIDGDKVVGNFGYVDVKPNGYTVHKEGSKFGKTFQFNELGKLHDYVKDMGEEDYMDDPYMMPQPAPSRPQTRPETPVKPGRPDTDKPSPSKRPFTPPPHIKPGEEPNPKAEYDDEEYYGPTEGMDYMDDDSMEMCQACKGRGHEQGGIGFGHTPKVCITCMGSGQAPRMEMDGEVDEPYVDSANPMGYKEEGSSTLPKGMGYRYQYKEKFNFPFNMGENSKSNKKTIKKELNEGYIEINGKTVRTYTQNGDTSYNVTYDDGTKDIIYVNNDGWDEINQLHRNAVNGTYRRKFIKEDHLNNKMASYEQEMAYEDVEDMARQHGMDVEFCHKDMAKDPEEQTIYLDLMKKGKAVAKIRINSAGQIEMGSMKGKAFKGEPVDSHSDFDEVLDEKGIKMMPQTAPARPQTAPDTPTKPAPTKPGTDKPSPSKRPFTPPPHIKPGEEPNPKARRGKTKTESYWPTNKKKINETVKVTKAQLFKSLDKMYLSDEKLSDLGYIKKLIDNVLDKEYDTTADNPEALAKEYIARNK